jgi:hypothetical protein
VALRMGKSKRERDQEQQETPAPESSASPEASDVPGTAGQASETPAPRPKIKLRFRLPKEQQENVTEVSDVPEASVIPASQGTSNASTEIPEVSRIPRGPGPTKEQFERRQSEMDILTAQEALAALGAAGNKSPFLQRSAQAPAEETMDDVCAFTRFLQCLLWKCRSYLIFCDLRSSFFEFF